MKRLLLSAAFLLLMLPNFILSGQTVTIGSGTNTGYLIPVNSNYGYTYSQQIVLQSEIATTGQISKIRFYMVGGISLSNSNNWTIYLGHTTKTTFGSDVDWEPLTNLTQVFTGTIAATPPAGWYEISLNTPFPYNNTSNLVVAVDENATSYNGSSNYVRIWTTPVANRAIHYRNDSTNPDPASPPTATGRLSYINQMQLYFQEPPCSGTPAPGNTISSANPVCPGVNFTLSLQNATPGTGVTYQWQSSATGGAPWTNLGTASTQVTSQTAATYYRCEVTCSGNTGTSNPILQGDPAPPTTQASAITTSALAYTTATITWTAGSGNRRYAVLNTVNSFTNPSGTGDVTVAGTAYSGSGEQIIYDGTGTSVSVTGLSANTTYYVRIFEYLRCTGTPNTNYYQTSTATNNPGSFTTLAYPTCPGGLGAGTVNIASLPYNSGTGQTTCGNGNNITSTNATTCGSSSYFGGEDKTYIFTPTSTGTYNIVLTTTTDDDAGIMLYNGCPFVGSGSTCVGNSQSTTGLTRTISTTLTSGITYYLVVDNFPSPACIGSYSLTIDLAAPPSCTTITTPANGATNVATSGNITFAAATGATSYDIYLSTGTPPTFHGNTATTTYAYSGLSPNTQYYVQIIPKNANGAASGCTITSFTTVPPPPSNDNCAGASQFPMIPTDGTCVTLSNQSTLGATNSNVTPTGSCTSNSGTPDDDIWFSFVAPATSVILEATFVSGNSDVYWHVFSSACASSMTAILCTDNNGGGTLTGLTIGNTYYIRLYTYSSGVSTVQNICLKTPPPPPSNDNCAGASQFPMIPTDGTCVTLSNQSTAGATNSNVTPTGACTSNSGTPDDDVWFSFVAPSTALILEATHVSGTTDVYWHVFSSACASSMTAILCTDTDGGGTLTGLTIGNTYYIRLYTWASGVSTVKNICLKTPPPPPDCATLNTPIDGSTGVTLTTALTWTPAGTGGTPTSYKVYHGTANPPTTFSTVTAPTTTFTPTGRTYNTLYYWYVVPLNASGDATGCNTTIFSYTTEAAPPPPANNDPCNGTALAFGGSQTGTTVNATASSVPDQACDGYTNTGADVWYKIDDVDVFTGGTLIITIDPSASQDYAIYLYSYTDCNAPVFLVCDDNGFGGDNETITYTIPAFTGGGGSSNRVLTDYLVRVKQWSTPSGTFSLSLAGTLPLQLLDIKATAMPKYNLIEWATASEKNTAYMMVERYDGSSLTWEVIGKTEAAGFSADIRKYSFDDTRPNQKAYYRVRSIDRDGLEQVSKKVFVDRSGVNTKPGLVNAYPMPVSKSLFVGLNVVTDQTATFHLVTITGQSVMQIQKDLKAGIQTVELDLSELPSGVYLARISSPELSETVRIIKE